MINLREIDIMEWILLIIGCLATIWILSQNITIISTLTEAESAIPFTTFITWLITVYIIYKGTLGYFLKHIFLKHIYKEDEND